MMVRFIVVGQSGIIKENHYVSVAITGMHNLGYFPILHNVN